MKRLFLTLLISVLVLSALVVPAMAASATAGNVTIEVTSTSTQVYPGEQGVVFTYTLKNTTGNAVIGVQFELTVPSGLTVTSGTIPAETQSIFPTRAEFVGNNKLFLSDLSEKGSNASSITLLNLTCSVADKNTVHVGDSLAVTLTQNQQLEVSHKTGETFTVTPVAKTVTVYHREDHDEDHTWVEDSVNTKAATCTKNGVKAEKCQDEQCTAKRTNVDPATGHKLTLSDAKSGNPNKFTWSDEGEASTATAWVECANPNCDAVDGYGNGGKSVTVKVEPNGEGTGATCTRGGSVGYTGTVTIEDAKHDGGAWTWTEKHTKEFPTGLGHDWTGTVQWSGWNENSPTSQVTASLTCKRCNEKTIEVQVTPTLGETVTETCTSDGKVVYNATADFSGKDDDNPVSKDKVPKDAKMSWTIIKKATGHKWPDTISEGSGDANYSWTKTPGDYSATATVKCLNANCKEYKDSPATLTGKVKKVEKAPTCKGPGSNTYTVEFETPDYATDNEHGKQYTGLASEVEDVAATGHTIGKVTFDWKDADGKTTPTGVTATATCTNTGCEDGGTLSNKDTVTVTEVKEPSKSWSEPTYEADGVHTYKASATFADVGGIGKDSAVQEEVKPFTIPKLEPDFTYQDVENGTSGEVTTEAGVKDTLGADAKTVVENALTQDTKAGIDDTLYDALKDAKEKVEGENLTVETKLVIEDKDLTDDKDVKAEIGDDTLEQVYDIHIDVKVTGSTLGTKDGGHITEVDTPITFTVDKPEGGPIWYVMRYHGGKWEPIDSRVDGDKIVFSSDKFSEFAIISSSDLAMAEVTPSAIPDQTYTGSPIQPKVELTINGGQKLTEGKDYVVAYENNTDVTDAARIVITPAEGSAFTGRIELTFKIVKAPAAGGSGSGTKPTEAPVPATGDETPVALYAAMLTLSAAALTLVLARRKRQK